MSEPRSNTTISPFSNCCAQGFVLRELRKIKRRIELQNDSIIVSITDYAAGCSLLCSYHNFVMGNVTLLGSPPEHTDDVFALLKCVVSFHPCPRHWLEVEAFSKGRKDVLAMMLRRVSCEAVNRLIATEFQLAFQWPETLFLRNRRNNTYHCTIGTVTLA